MKIAHLRNTRKPVTVEQYVDAYGPKLDARAVPRQRPSVMCLACQSEMHTLGEAGPLRDAVWGHNPSPDIWCPVKEASANPYEILTPTEPDAAAGLALRTSFFKNWKKHWWLINDIVPLCDIYTFTSFLKRCDQLSFWSQPGLQEWFIPYIFLASCDFPPPSGKGRKLRTNWLRCRFDSRVRDARDLWIRTNGDWGFVLLTYKSPRRGEPNSSHLTDMKEVIPRPLFLEERFEKSNSYQEKAMAEAFP